MRVVADLADEFGHDEIRVTPRAEPGPAACAASGDLSRSGTRLEEAGLATANIDLISDIIACPGMDYCALATARSIPIAQAIADAVRRPRPAARRSAS